VDFPIDFIVLDARTGSLCEQRFTSKALADAETWWREALQAALSDFPLGWAEELLTSAN
jgi:hypothetical protein